MQRGLELENSSAMMMGKPSGISEEHLTHSYSAFLVIAFGKAILKFSSSPSLMEPSYLVS
jgi:hypothetical protein